MAIPFTIPPWLSVRPTDFAQANQSGMNSGIAAAHIWAAAAEEQARLQQSARQHDMESALAEERLQQKSIYDAQALAVDSAKNKAMTSMAEAKLKQTQDNAARMAKQWEMQQEANRQRQADLAIARQTRLDQGQARIDISKQNADDMAKYRQSLMDKKKAVDPLEAQLAGLGTKPPTDSGPGILSRFGKGISDFFTGDSGAPTAPSPSISEQKAQRANALAKENPDWSKDKIIKAVHDEFSEPAPDEEPSPDEEQ